jgi:RimJ/RimL family protein N-acetyltransferase
MKNSFVPGGITHSFVTKSGKQAEIKNPSWDILHQKLQYVNELSQEDTFVSFSGEEIALREEADFLAKILIDMELGNAVFQYCFVDGQLVGICGIDRKTILRKRGEHIGRFGLSVHRDFRNDGIGFILAKTAIDLATKHIRNLKIIELECFANNTGALHLYEKLGFQEVGRLPNFILFKGQYIDEVKMTLELD